MHLVIYAVSLLIAVDFVTAIHFGDWDDVVVPRGGDTASLHCPAGSSNIDWAKVVSGTVEDLSSAVIDRIVVDCALQPNRSSLYAVSLDSATGRCDLVIKNAESSHAGIYLCYESDDVVTSAKFLVADPERNVTGSQSSYVAVGGDVVNYSCQMLFHESGIPMLNWAGPRHFFWRRRESPGSGGAARVRNMSTTLYAVIPDGPATVSYTCYVDRVHWKHVFWQSTAINVSYCPKDIQITGAQNGSAVMRDTVLTCSAEAHPSPSYLWTDAVGGSTVEGPTFNVAAGNYYSLTCTATNNLTHANGTTRLCTSSVYFQVNGFTAARSAALRQVETALLLTALMTAAILLDL